jgi:hypothetical protein
MKGRCVMFWVPYAGAVPLSLVWPSGIATTSFGLAALIAAGRLALLILQAARARTVAVPRTAAALEDESEVKQAAA